MVAGPLRDAVADEVDLDYLIWTVVWSVHGFLSGGMVYSDPRRYPGRDQQRGPGASPAAIEDFRSYLHRFLGRMLVFKNP
jgi:hypothetical protein